MQLNFETRTVFLGDNIDFLRGMNSECVDLIYADPPFNKKKEFTAPIGSQAEGASFLDYFTKENIKDEWVEEFRQENFELHSFLSGIKAIGNSYNYCYLVYMAIRFIECQRILKPTGSFYLHCDQTMSHYLKLLLDSIFDENNFHDEIVWKRATSAQKGSQFSPKKWGTNSDSVFYYTKSSDFVLNPYGKMTPEQIVLKFNRVDDKGERYFDDSAHIWRTPGLGPRPNLCYEWRGFKNPNSAGWRLSKVRLEEEYQCGNIVIRQNGKLERRKYLKNYKGAPRGNLWMDINPASGKERTGWPTQKPLALLERIIVASSNEGDLVLDPFCGCVTTCIAAEILQRKWVGIDVAKEAWTQIEIRLQRDVPPDLFRGKANFSTTPPERGKEDVRPKKYVYVISNPAFPGMFKVGIATNVETRLSSYQTSYPKRAYQLEFKILTAEYKTLEPYIHHKFNGDYEWVPGDLNTIIKAMKDYTPT